MKKIGAVLAILATVAAVLLLQHFFGKSALPQHAPIGLESLVVVERAGVSDFADRLEAIGTGMANEAVTITSTDTKKVVEILFENGQTVKKGDVLVRLDNNREQALVDAARVSLTEKKRELERIRTLRAKAIVSEKELDAQLTLFDTATAELQVAQANLEFLTITVPFDGVLGIRRISPGTLVTPGDVITTLDDLSVIKLEFTVPELFLTELKPGQTIEASSAALRGETFTGIVTAIDTRVDSTTRAVVVQAKLPNPEMRLRPGMLFTVSLICNQRRTVSVPEKALVAFSEKQFVFVLTSNGTAQKREVRIGRRDAGRVEILQGLDEGEQLIVDGTMDLRDGAQVRIAGSLADAAQAAASEVQVR